MNSDSKQCSVTSLGRVYNARAQRAHCTYRRSLSSALSAPLPCAHLTVSPSAAHVPGRAAVSCRAHLVLMPAWPIMTPRVVLRHATSHPCSCLVVAPLSSRDPKETRPCCDTKTKSRHQFYQTVSPHQKLCCDTTLAHPASSMLRHQQWVATPLRPTMPRHLELCRHTNLPNQVTTPKIVLQP